MADRIEAGSRVRIGRVPGAEGKTGKVMRRDDVAGGNGTAVPPGQAEVTPFLIVRVDDSGRLIPVPENELTILEE